MDTPMIDRLELVQAIAECGDAEELTEAVLALAEDTPLRATFAAGLISAQLNGGLLGDMAAESDRIIRLSRLLPIADQDPPNLPRWHQTRTYAHTLVSMYEAATSALPIPTIDFETLRAMPGITPELAALLGVYEDVNAVLEAMDQGRDPGAARERLERSIRAFPAESGPLREQALMAWMSVVVAEFTREDTMGGTPELTLEELDVLALLARRPELAAENRALIHLLAGTVWLCRSETDEPDAVTQAALEHFEQAKALSAERDPNRVAILMSLGVTRMRWMDCREEFSMLDEAEEDLFRALELCGDPQHPLWDTITQHLDLLYGDVELP